MVIEWSPNDNKSRASTPFVRAAEYVRMSTEHQKYSTDNQSSEIRRYAAKRGFEIVRTYADEGKSGLRIDGRGSLQQLLEDIDNGRADFGVILVYDVSRWGRFQDPDEAAHYELRCKRAGITVHYCAEQFENDGTIGSSIIKTVKRAMAGEYSRELSVKVFAGQCRLIGLGYRQGGAPGFGLRRMLVDEFGREKALLERGEQKSIATDRVILVEGPADEVTTVHEIYRLFVEDELTERQIADQLNALGKVTDQGRQWTRGTVHQILINEKYVGHNVWGRTSFKLKSKHVRNDPANWIRCENAFAAIIGQDLFDAAQTIIDQRSKRLTDDEMLAALSSILQSKGLLSALIIDEFEDSPSSSSYRSRFGSLLRAYLLVGYTPKQDYRYLEINRSLRRMHPAVVKDIIAGVNAIGGTAFQNLKNDLLTINDEIQVSVVIARCKLTASGSRRWKLRLDESLKPDLTICVRMDEANLAPSDFYLLPRMTLEEGVLRLAEHNGLSFDAFRRDTLDEFYKLASRAPFRQAA